MHTFAKQKDGTYAVGQWLQSAIEYRFIVLFHVGEFKHAIDAVNTLNGTIAPVTFPVLSYPKKPQKLTITPMIAALAIGMIYGAIFASKH